MASFVREMAEEYGVTFLILSEGSVRDVVCPIASAVWKASRDPFRDGPEGYGQARAMPFSKEEEPLH